MRAGLAGTLSQGVRAFDFRRSRSIGLAKPPLQPLLIAVAINMGRVGSWLTEPRLSKPYVAPFAALAAPAEEFASRVNIGVTPVASYEIKRVDTDYFAGE